MQAISFKPRIISALLIGLACASITACGGGGDGEPFDTVIGLQEHAVSPSDEATGKVGYRLPIVSRTETFGPAISTVEWEVEPLSNAQGELEIGDPTCEKGQRSSRSIPNSEKVIVTWTCETSVMPRTGANGQFEIRSHVTLETGASQTAGFVLTVK